MKKLIAITISLIFILEGIGHAFPANARNRTMLRKPLYFRKGANLIETPLLNRRIHITETVLYPDNVFTESFLRFIDTNKELFKGKRVLELGTGSGVLAIALARAGAMVVAGDISPEAVEIAQKNIKEEDQAVQGRIKVFVSDLYKGIPSEDMQRGFDFVVFNHPIYARQQIPEMPMSFNAYAGADFSVIRDAISGLPGVLKPQGRAFFWALHGELGHERIEYQDIEAVLWTDQRMQGSLPDGWSANPVNNFTPAEFKSGDPNWVIKIVEIYNAKEENTLEADDTLSEHSLASNTNNKQNLKQLPSKDANKRRIAKALHNRRVAEMEILESRFLEVNLGRIRGIIRKRNPSLSDYDIDELIKVEKRPVEPGALIAMQAPPLMRILVEHRKYMLNKGLPLRAAVICSSDFMKVMKFVLDGHHRARSAYELGQNIEAYVITVPSDVLQGFVQSAQDIYQGNLTPIKDMPVEDNSTAKPVRLSDALKELKKNLALHDSGKKMDIPVFTGFGKPEPYLTWGDIRDAMPLLRKSLGLRRSKQNIKAFRLIDGRLLFIKDPERPVIRPSKSSASL